METLELPVLEDVEQSVQPQDQDTELAAYRAWREGSRWYNAAEEDVPLPER
jgi:hypothetical protein